MKKDEYKMSQQVDTTDYKQKYEEALERAKDLHDNHPLGQPQTWMTCEKIKEEIEKRIESMNSCPFKTAELGSEKFDEGELYAYKQTLQFIDSLSKQYGCETKDDLEAEIQRYFSEEKWIEKPVSEIAIHFANWQHGKDFDDLLQSEMKFPKEYYERGMADMRNEILEKAEKFFNEEFFTRFNGSEYRVASNKCMNLQQFIELFKNYMQNESEN